MRILYFSPRKCWPVNAGARLRDYQLARQLARRASVSYFGLFDPAETAPEPENDGLIPPEAIFERSLVLPKAPAYGVWNLVRGLAGPTPVTVLNYTSRSASAALADLGREMTFDAVQMEGVHLARYIPVLRAFPGRPPVLCDWHDIFSESMTRYSETVASFPRRLYARRTARLLEGMETELLRLCDAHLVVSDRNKRRLLENLPSASLHIIENGVDTAYHSEEQIEDAYARWLLREKGTGEYGRRNRVVFVGAMDYNTNIDAVAHFAADIWPRVRERVPELSFTIVGRNPAPEVIALEGQPGIEVSGTVADVRPYYREASVVIVPLRLGSGTRLKILEAMAAGVPVVSTTLGAEGLAARPGEEILIADTPADTVEAIVRLRRSPELRQALREQGRKLAVSRYEWRVIGERLYSIYENVVDRVPRLRT
ncbi:MAG: glycosyltransferase [Actinobacteria bacterium]|nr:MAG: glycosyltransferase [Actinomycetota bacterium]